MTRKKMKKRKNKIGFVRNFFVLLHALKVKRRDGRVVEGARLESV